MVFLSTQHMSQFLRELHFIEALKSSGGQGSPQSQFLRELHFIEATIR